MKIIYIAALLLVAVVIYAHEGHKEKTKPDTVTIVNGDTIAINGKPTNKIVHKQELIEKKEPEFVLKPVEAMFEHLHNKIVHFPIALSAGAFLLMFFYLKDERYRKAILVLILLAFLSAVGAYFTGEAQKTAFENTNKMWVAETHELLGIFSAISIFVWLISLLSVKYKKISLIMSLVTIALVLVTGFFGGVLAH